MLNKIFLFCCLAMLSNLSIAQSFYFGADLSYVNEMEDCGVLYQEDQVEKDPYAIFGDNGCNLVRLRLWHTPSWYDGLNNGNRYSDLEDVKRAIARAKGQNLDVLLDFHLSDNWADPSKQLVPNAWLPVVNDLDLLKDSLYNYMYETLTELNEENLLPELIQIGNETNKGILLSPEDNSVWTLDWERNVALFNHAIKAVEDFEQEFGKEIKIVLHVAGPENAEWLIDGFAANGVSDFDIIGLSYYWAWHKPTSIKDAGDVIKMLKNIYPQKEVIIAETGYIWTTEFNDNASNIISETHPDYHPASPVNQRDWLIDLTKEVIQSGGMGLIYWEPAWVSSPCYTQWGQGSHQEHATFFDFDNNLLIPGGAEWMNYNYDSITGTTDVSKANQIQILTNSFSGEIKIKQHSNIVREITYLITDTLGNVVRNGHSQEKEVQIILGELPHGVYVINVMIDGTSMKSKKMVFGKG